MQKAHPQHMGRSICGPMHMKHGVQPVHVTAHETASLLQQVSRRVWAVAPLSMPAARRSPMVGHVRRGMFARFGM